MKKLRFKSVNYKWVEIAFKKVIINKNNKMVKRWTGIVKTKREIIPDSNTASKGWKAKAAQGEGLVDLWCVRWKSLYSLGWWMTRCIQ